VSRSSVQASVTEALDGSATIIVLGQVPAYLTHFQRVVDVNSAALLNFVTAQRWLGFRIELLGSVVVLVAGVLLTSLNDVFRIEAGLVGLLIVWSANFTVTLGFLVDTFGEAEAAITAIERVDAMAHLPQERERETKKSLSVMKSWPESGELIFNDVTLRYRPGLPLALTGLNFRVAAGKRCGIVGRTGAGKSSLTVALFRLVEIESGSILLVRHDGFSRYALTKEQRTEWIFPVLV
jgi:ABC-type multidrug transport system fused ATPase/permease subunit